MKTKRIISLIASGIMAVSAITFAACGKDNYTANKPIYDGTDKHFDYYAYHSISDGKWVVDGDEFTTGEDFRTVERIREYKDAGMTILLPQSKASITYGTQEELDVLKHVMDISVEGGIDKVIVSDYRFVILCREMSEGGIIGEGETTDENIKNTLKFDKKFKDEAALDAYVRECIDQYKDHEAFYGVLLQDEPNYKMATAYGQVYKSIKRVCPDAYIQVNLLPMENTTFKNYPPLEGKEDVDEAGRDSADVPLDELVARYRLYVSAFLDATGCPYLQYDQYPMTASKGIIGDYIRSFQESAEMCKERGIELKHIAQTISYTNNGQLNRRQITEDDARYLNNMMLGFGVKQIMYYTFWTKSENNTAETTIDGSCFIDWYGNKTDLYYFMQEIIKENSEFENVILNFDYSSSCTYSITPTVYSDSQVSMAKEGTFKKVTSVEIDKECALVTELYDAKKDNYMYMLQNVVNPVYKGRNAYQTITVSFPAEYQYVSVFKNGKRSEVKLVNGQFAVSQTSGEAVFVIPY